MAFVIGFVTCAAAARLMLPTPVAAVSPGSFSTANPADVVAAVAASVVNLEVYDQTGEGGEKEGVWPRLLGIPAGVPGDPSAVASGVIIDSKGFILTNDHVVEEAARIRARLSDGRSFDAKVVGRDPHTDLAVVKIDAGNLQPARLGDSRHVRPGDSVVAIGNPLGFESSVSVGVVSANREGPFRIDGRTLGDMIQTDAAINQGNSGGGLFTADGKLIGINTAIMVAKGGSGSIGIGFATPTHRARPVLESLIAEGKVSRPWLGIRYRNPSSGYLVRRARQGVGLMVEEVLPRSPASLAGLMPADILRQIGECPIRSADDMYTFMARYQPGQEVEARVLRGGVEKKLRLKLAARPE
ncbi:MAG: S1C family serine protease [Armatimonadota bacterium]